VSALSLGAWSAGAFAATPPAPVYKTIYDQDHPAALNFGRAAAAAGQQTQAIGRDVTSLWYDDLYHRWREGPAAIAGLTSFSVAFCLELMAWDAGLRTVFRAEHTLTADGRIRHAIVGPDPVLARASLLDTGQAWGAGAARLLSDCNTAGGARSPLTLNCAGPTSAAYAEPLVSWVFAPVTRA
jgi:hypothetical protein